MNILSISQVQTQTSLSDLSQLSSQKSDDSGKSSFEDYLRDARKSSEDFNKVDKGPEENQNKVVKNEENSENKTLEEKVGEKKPDNEKSEKVAQKRSSEDEKSEEKAREFSDYELNDEKALRVELSQIQNQRNFNDSKVDIENESKNLVLGEKNAEIDDKTLRWLISQSKSEAVDEEISSEDFASLIDAAVEFIPGNETEGEKLESAQNLAASDPEMFLNAVNQNTAEMSEIPGKNQKNKLSLNLDSDKISSSKVNKNNTKISVHDLRTNHLFEDRSANVDAAKAVQKSADKKEFNLTLQQQNENNIQMTMELANRAQQNITSSSGQAAATGSDFQNMLSNAVQENVPDFVKAGNIVLKDNNHGSINLILRPEGLGNVKISLNLDDKNLSAQITVQTKEAMNAFKESIPSLKEAFTESGFETGSFDLNFSDNSSGYAQGGEQSQQRNNAGVLAHKSYGEYVTSDALKSGESGEAYSADTYSVNIVA